MAENAITLTLGGSLELVLRPPSPPGYVTVTTSFGHFTITARGTHMAYKMPVDHFITVEVSYTDKHGNPATVDGEVTWASSAEDVATVESDVAENSARATITSVGKVGTAQITATVDADLGEGVRELITMLDLEVVAGEAVAGTINITGEAQPVP